MKLKIKETLLKIISVVKEQVSGYNVNKITIKKTSVNKIIRP
jgi:hypothetical protein